MRWHLNGYCMWMRVEAEEEEEPPQHKKDIIPSMQCTMLAWGVAGCGGAFDGEAPPLYLCSRGPCQQQRANRERGRQRPSHFHPPFINAGKGSWCSIHEPTWGELVCVAGSRGAMDDDGLVVKISRPVNGSCYTIQDRRRIHITSSASRQRDSFLQYPWLSIQVQCVQSSVQCAQDNPNSR